MIVNLSAPNGRSVNDGISKELRSLPNLSVDHGGIQADIDQSTLRLPEVCIKCHKIEFIWPYMAVNDIHRLLYAHSLVVDTISSIFLHRHKAKIYKLYKDDLQSISYRMI